jgi:nucleotide-binding universal stress UspA family protein
MQLKHVVAAVDDSAEGRAALGAACVLASRAGARITVLTVAGERALDEAATVRTHRELEERARVAVASLPSPPPIEVAVGFGLPGVEISRFAETHRGDLIVVGRKWRSERQRLLLGDTADAVARRAGVPVLFVHGEGSLLPRVLVALDGTGGIGFARATGARLRVVSVESSYDNEQGLRPVLTAKSEQLVEMVQGLRKGTDLAPGQWDEADGSRSAMVVQRGPVVEAILAEARRSECDVLVVGCHRGGPAGVIDAGSVGRRLLHEAPITVLTLPL